MGIDASAFLGILAAILTLGGAQDVGCEDPSYAFDHLDECGELIPPETEEETSSDSEEVGCEDPSYALDHLYECGTLISPELPDLTLGPITMLVNGEPSSSAVKGDEIKFLTTLSNIGDFDASSFEVTATLGSRKIFDPRFSGLAANSEKDVEVRWTALEGDHVLIIEVDPDNEVEEVNELNNLKGLVSVRVEGEIMCEEQLLDTIWCSEDGTERLQWKQNEDCSKEQITVETCNDGCNFDTATCKPATEVIICTERALDNYRCNGNQKQIKWNTGESSDNECTQEWRNIGNPCTQECREDFDSKTGRTLAYCFNTPQPPPPQPDPDPDARPTAVINVPGSAAPGSQISISVTGFDDKDVAQLLLFDVGNNQIGSFDCLGTQTSCSAIPSFTVTAPIGENAVYTFKAKSKDNIGQLSDFVLGTGTTTTTPPPVIPPDNVPTATISVNSPATPNSQLNILVTGTDDNKVSELLLFDSNGNQIGSPFTCPSSTSCSHLFNTPAPATHSTAYTFKARSKDSAGQLSAFVSTSGTTTAAPVVPPDPDPDPQPDPDPTTPLGEVSVKFPSQPLFVRAANFYDSGCISPGDSGFFAVKIQNKGRTTLKNVKFIATVPELGMRSSVGPVSLSTDDKSTRYMMIDVPPSTEPGEYYLRLSVSDNKNERTIYRTFIVGNSC